MSNRSNIAAAMAVEAPEAAPANGAAYWIERAKLEGESKAIALGLKADAIKAVTESAIALMAAESEAKPGTEKVAALADREARNAFLARYYGASKAELSEVLGKVHGFKTTAEGKQSKTPAGRGEDIRKRAERLAACYEYVSGKDIPGLFKDIPAELSGDAKEAVSDIVQAVMDDSLSIWSAYDAIPKAIAKLKPGKADPAFDVEHLAKLADKLREAGSVDYVNASPVLCAAYGELAAVIMAVLDAGRDNGD